MNRNEFQQIMNQLNAIRQYIGARYVPKFIDDPWTDTIEYEPLSVVNVSGTSYISGVPVPVGTPITNRDYWHLYGASSGAIINLQNQIDDMKDPDVPGSLQEQINDNASDITALANEVSIYTYRFDDDIILLGDSWSTGVEANHGIADFLPDYIPHNNWYNGIIGSCSFAGNPPTNYEYQLQQVALVVPDPTTIKHIIVQGDVNDQGLNTGTEYNSFLNYAHTTFPNATIDLFTVNRSWYRTIQNHTYINMALIGAKYPYVRMWDLTHKLPIDGWTSQYHCGEDNYRLVAKMMADCLKGASPESGYSEIVTSGTAVQDNTWTVPDIKEKCINGSLIIMFPLAAQNNVNVGSSAGKRIEFTLDDNLHGSPDINRLVFVRLDADNSGTNYKIVQAVAALTASNEIRVNWQDLPATTSYYQITIYGFTLDIGFNY